MSRLLNISLIQLEYLISLDEHRHFIKAAEACFVTQPTLSMQIKKLEEELGVKLFDRSKHPVIPTDVGSKIIQQARKVVRETERIDNILQEYKGIVAGDLTIGIIPTVSQYLMPHLISKISKQFPDIRLHVKEIMTEDILKLLREDHLDIGIVATPLGIDGLIEKPIFYEKFCPYLNPNHPAYKKSELDVNDLLLDKLWLLSEGNCFRNQTINLCSLKNRSEVTNHFDYESGSIDTLIKIVNMEGGSTVIPEWASLELKESDKLHLRPIAEKDQVREVSLIYTRHFAKAKLLENFHQILVECVPDLLKLNSNSSVINVM